MTEAASPMDPQRDYEVGYGRPPVQTRFRKGHSGNPRGRPPGSITDRAKRIVLEEAYRSVTVKEGEKVIRMPAIRAVMRSHLRDALKGNGPNQRAVLALVQVLESEINAEKRRTAANDNPPRELSSTEVARRIAFVLNRAAREREKKHQP
jgi:hypothetical protein